MSQQTDKIVLCDVALPTGETRRTLAHVGVDGSVWVEQYNGNRDGTTSSREMILNADEFVKLLQSWADRLVRIRA